MKKHKNNQRRSTRHPLQQPSQYTPVRPDNNNRYVNNRQSINNSSTSTNSSNNSRNNSSTTSTSTQTATNYQHSQHKSQSLQRFYASPQSNTGNGNSDCLGTEMGQNSPNNSTNRSIAQQSTLAQLNPALAYTVEHIGPSGLDLNQCKLIDRMYDVDEDSSESALLTTHQQHYQSRTKPNKTIPEESIPLHETCRQHNIPAHALFSLSHISSLTSYASAGSIVIFDIDDTLVKRKNYDSSLLSSLGTTMLHSYLQSPACNEMAFETKQEIVNKLGVSLRTFVLAEDDTATVVRTLQDRGCYVFALTARNSTMSSTTNQSLSSLGIDLTRALPLSMPSHAIETQTGAAVIDGVIYCNDCPKGLVFQKFLSSGWISFPIIHQCASFSCGSINNNCPQSGKIVSCTKNQSAHHKSLPCPERSVWFVDDSFTMLQSMLQQWQGQAEKQLEFFSSLSPVLQEQMPCQGKMALVCCHYTHPTNYSLNPAANPAPIPNQQVLERVVAVQIAQFVNTGEVINDAQALNMLGYNTA